MHSALREAARSEWGLVAFTTLLPTSIGILLVAALAEQPVWLGVLAVLVGGAGLLGSVGHLARPMRSPLSVLNWRRSWLSREILAAAAYWVLTIGWVLASWLLPAVIPLLCAIAMGGVLIWVIARAYRVQTRLAWDGPEGVAELTAVALVVGVPAGMVGLALVAQGGSLPEPSVKWFGVGAVSVGLLLQYWATIHRLQRLLRLPANTNGVAQAICRCQELRPSSLIVTALDGIALLGVLTAAIVPSTQETSAQPWLYGVAFLAGLAGHLLARLIFYSAATQKRFAAKIRPPLSMPGAYRARRPQNP